MKNEKAMYLTLLKCDKKMERNYNKQVKYIKKHFKGQELEEKLKNLDEQHYASLLALSELITSKKAKLETVTA